MASSLNTAATADGTQQLRADAAPYRNAAGLGDLQLLQQLHAQQSTSAWDETVTFAAAANGHLHVLRWLLSQHCPAWDVDCALAAGDNGHHNILKYLRHQFPSCCLPSRAMRVAAMTGRLKAMQAFRQLEPPCPWDASVCTAAAHTNNLEMLKYLRGQQPPCPWDESTTMAAAEAGHLPVLEMLRDPASSCCPWDRSVALSAALGGHMHILRWVHSQAPFRLIDHHVGIVACRQRHVEILDWLLCEDILDESGLLSLCVTSGHHKILTRPLHNSGRMDRQTAGNLLLSAVQGDLTHARLTVHELLRRDLLLSALVAVIEVTGRESEAGSSWGRAIPMQHLEVAQLLLGHMSDEHMMYAEILSETAAACQSIMLVQLAARGVQPRIPWDATIHSLAAAQGDLTLLRWLLAQQPVADTLVVHQTCPDSRMLLLVHGHGWSIPSQMCGRLATAESRRWAYLGVVQRQRSVVPPQQPNGTYLGHLPDALITKIACAAGLHFSWTFST